MLFCWGAQEKERLCLLQPDKKVKHGTSAVQDVSAGRSLVGFVQDGKVSILKLGREDNDQDGKLKQLPLKNDRIRSIVCGGEAAVLLAYGGKVIIMDKSTVCRPLKGLENRQVIQIACGDQHSMALTKDGQVFVWGVNSHGQLGLGRVGAGSVSAQHLQSLCGIPVSQISAGGKHSFVLSLSGVVFGWGNNSVGQLGLGDTTDRHVPTIVKNLNGKKIVSISCGGEHTAALSKGGTVFTFGSGGFGQLGHNSFKDEHHPRVVAELWGSEVSQVTCGRHHTFVLVASTNRIYSFGCGEQGQLGNGEMIKQSVAFPVDLPSECNNGYTIEKVITGDDHSFALFSKLGSKSKPNLSQGILTLDDRMIERWVSGRDPWKVVKKDINTVFSSAASLNGSFLKTSCDEHYQTSEVNCGLDFDLIKTSFAKLSEDEKSVSEVLKVFQRALLSLNPNPAGVEALRLYLLLPELIKGHKEQQTELIDNLASKILELDRDARKVLEMYWSKLPDDWLKTLVDLFKNASAELIGRTPAVKINEQMTTRLAKLVRVLQRVYKVCCRANRNITKSDFIIHDINYLLDVLQTTNEDVGNNWLKFNLTEQINEFEAQLKYYNTILQILTSLPCIFNMEAKCSLMKNRARLFYLQLFLRRTALLEDCFAQLIAVSQQQHIGGHWLSVFYVEDFKKTDVNKKDFFINVFKEFYARDSQLLMYNDNKTLNWFPTKLTVPKEVFFLFGILCGLAFDNNCVVNLPFPLALFKKLLDVKPSLEDLVEFDPVQGRSLQYILDYSDDVEEMDMNFTVTWDGTQVELDPDEPGKTVTNSNRTEFVEKYVDYILNKSVEETFEEFKRGFFRACERRLVKMFEPEELRGVIVGNEEYDWDKLKQNAKYERPYDADHPTIIFFWEVFDELTPNQKKSFLLFVTGFERVPIMGMSGVKMRVTILPNSTKHHLPEALTCHTLLQLPVYKTKKTLRAKLIEAINHKRGFWED